VLDISENMSAVLVYFTAKYNVVESSFKFKKRYSLSAADHIQNKSFYAIRQFSSVDS